LGGGLFKMSEPDFILFDLDNTLYPRDCGLFDRVDFLINRYLAEIVNIPTVEVDRLRRSYLENYGTTLNGLIVHHQVDPHHYLEYVHDVRLADYLVPNPDLAILLSELPGKKYIFSNASRQHCLRVLDYLGLNESFVAVFDINYFNFRPKPAAAIYRELITDIKVRPENGVMIDDMLVNLEPAAALGMATFHYNPSATLLVPLSGDTRQLNSMWQLPQLLADLP